MKSPHIQQRSFRLRQIMVSVVMLGALFMTTTSFMQSGAAPRKASTTVRHRLSKQITEPVRKTNPHAATVDQARFVAAPNAIAVASNYTFTDTSNASLTDMSSGTTQLIARIRMTGPASSLLLGSISFSTACVRIASQ